MYMASNYTDSFEGAPYFIKKSEQLSAAGVNAALNTKEKVENKVTTINSQATDAQYPSAKTVYDILSGTSNDVVHKAGTETITGVKVFSTSTTAAEPLLGKAKTTDATNDGAKFATEAQVHKAIGGKQDKLTYTQLSLLNSLSTLSFFPKGTILTFSAAAWDAKDEAFKAIWKVCDGSPGSGTPNLVGKFLRGAAYPAGTTDGADSSNVILETKHMPKHNHSFRGTAATGNIPIGEGTTLAGNGMNWVFSSTPASVGWGLTAYSNLNSIIKFSMTPSGSISETGGGSAASGYGESFNVPTVPSYYTVIYIMKVA
jgi:hypothetical protein